MTLSYFGDKILKEHEGLRLKMYQDTKGIATIGYGHNLVAKPIPLEAAEVIYRQDVQDAIKDCITNFPWFMDLDTVRQEVIIMLVFNMGVQGVSQFKLMIQALKEKNWARAAFELSNSKWRSDVGEDRHRTLTDALETGRWPKQ